MAVSHILHCLLPEQRDLVDWPTAIKKQISNSTRSEQPFQKNSFIPYAIANYQ